MAKLFAPDVTTCATHRVLHRLSCRARIGDDVQRPGGLHFGQGALGVFQRDARAAPVLAAATALMRALIAKSQPR